MSPPAADLSDFEGLVCRTAQLLSAQVGIEEEDLRQDLRLKICKVLQAFDPVRNKTSERGFVYGCVANCVKDLKRDAARRSRGRLTVVHTEDYRQTLSSANPNNRTLDAFEFRYQHVDHEEIYGVVEDEGFVMPPAVTEEERRILFLLTLGYPQTQIAMELGVEYAFVDKCVRSLRKKLVGLKPVLQPVAA